MLFTIAQQLQRGIDLVTDATERSMIVFIHWEAGKKSMATGACALAAAYFELAISTLQQTAWTPETYDICLALHNGAAEAYYSSGDFARMDQMLSTVFEKAKTFDDTLQAHTTLVFANGSRNRYREPVDTAFDVLRQLGQPLAFNPSKLDVFREFFKLRCVLHGKSNRFFSNLPLATNTNKIAAMTLLNFTVMYSYQYKPEYGALAMFALIRLAIEHGMTGAAAFAISGYGAMLATVFGRIEEGYRYGQIALDLLDRAESKAWRARIFFMVYGAINPWMRPFRESLEPLLYAQRSALKTGDIEGSFICGWFQLMMAFHMGRPLVDTEQEASALYHLMQAHGQTSSLTFLLGLCRLTSELCGQSTLQHGVTVGDQINTVGAVGIPPVGDENKPLIAFHAICRTFVACLMGDYHTAVHAAQQAQDCSTDKDYSIDFYEGLSSLALARDVAPGCWPRRRTLIAKGRRALKRLKRCAMRCPSNFDNKRDLLHAELESIRGRPVQSFALFEASIKMAQKEGFVQEEGLAYERLGQYQCYLGHPLIAVPYFKCARDAYTRWGAQTLVHRMNELIAERTITG